MNSKFFDRCQPLVRKFYFETVPMPYMVTTFMSILALRIFLEMALVLHHPYWDDAWVFVLHSVLCFIFMAFILILFFYWMTSEKITNIARLVMTFFLILLIVPFIDRTFGFWKSFHLDYFVPGKYQGSLWMKYLTFGGPLSEQGATPGVRIEVSLMILASAFYIFVITRRPWRAILGGALFYTIIFGVALAPVFLDRLDTWVGFQNLDINAGVFARYYAFLVAPLGIWLFALAKPDIVKELIKDIRWQRFLYYYLLIVLGWIYYGQTAAVHLWQPQVFFSLLFLAVSSPFAALFCIITNNLADVQTDRLSNSLRPSVTQRIPKAYYQSIAWWSLVLSMFYALMASPQAMAVMAAFIGAYFLYSAPPLRLKRISVLSKVVIGFNSLLMFMLGYMLIDGAVTIPVNIVLFFTVFVGLTSNFIDLKDIAGDRASGIKTLPVLIGEKTAKYLIGTAFFISFLFACHAFALKGAVVFCLIAGMAQFFVVNYKFYSDDWVMNVNLVSLLFVIFYKVFVH